MAKLITNHDPYHTHKTLGVFVLLHYIYRFYILFKTGKTSFPENESRLQASICVALHGVLSLSSLLLPLPKKRNFNAPMIWFEFRLHSIVFAMRHVIATLFTLNGLWPSENFLLLRALAKISLVIMTSRLAATVTGLYGCNDKRTTNSMPYPPGTTEKQQKYIKFIYAKAQFVATIYSLEEDPTRNFFPMLAIQMAPLLMTLVRKAKISALMYHRVYISSIYISFIVGAFIFVIQNETRPVILAPLIELTIYSRIRFGVPHWLLWTVYGMSMVYLYPVHIHHPLLSVGVVDFLLRFQILFAFLPLGEIVYNFMLDPRPLKESVKHWPFLKFDEKFYDSQYFMKSAKKTDSWIRLVSQVKFKNDDKKKKKDP